MGKPFSRLTAAGGWLQRIALWSVLVSPPLAQASPPVGAPRLAQGPAPAGQLAPRRHVKSAPSRRRGSAARRTFRRTSPVGSARQTAPPRSRRRGTRLSPAAARDVRPRSSGPSVAPGAVKPRVLGDDEDEDEDDNDDDDRDAGAAQRAVAAPGAVRRAPGCPPGRRPPGGPAGQGCSGRAGDQDVADDDEDDDEEEEDSPGGLHAGAEADFNSRFIWRGLAFSRGPVLQPSLWSSWGGLSLGLWANLMLTEQLGHPLTVVVPTLTYAHRWRRLELETGLYIYTETAAGAVPPSGGELTLKMSYDLDLLAVETEQYVRVLAGLGAYFGSIGLLYLHEWDRWSLTATTKLGWANAHFNAIYFDESRASLNVFELALVARYEVNDWLFVAPRADLHLLLAPVLRARHPHALTNLGVTLGVEL